MNVSLQTPPPDWKLEYLRGAAGDLRKAAADLDQMAAQGIDGQRLDEIARRVIQPTVEGLKDAAYWVKKEEHRP